ncbi:unnamed protein product [Parajaminaea phylloscopi]
MCTRRQRSLSLRKAGDDHASQLHLIGQILVDATWLPSWAEIKTAYNVTAKVLNSKDVEHDAEAADAMARFQVAYWYGPIHYAKTLGLDTKEVQEEVQEEYRTLLTAVCAPDVLCNRGCRVLCTKAQSTFKLSLMPLVSSGEKKPHFSRAYTDQERMEEDAEVLLAMLSDPSWSSRSEKDVFEAWSQLHLVKSFADDWMAGKRNLGHAVPGSLRPVVERRTEYKHCRAPGLSEGCYRDKIGQICARSGGPQNSTSAARFGIDLADFGLQMPHDRPQAMRCSEMMTHRQCLDHWVWGKLARRRAPWPQTYEPDDSDSRLVRPTALLAAQVPRLDTCMSSLGSDESAVAAAIFVSSAVTDVVDRCAVALELVPKFDALHASRPSLDHLMTVHISSDGAIAAHTPANLRIVDTARNMARGRRHSALQADLLEAAIVCNNVVRSVLGDAKADSRLAEIETALEATEAEDPAWRRGPNTCEYDFAI